MRFRKMIYYQQRNNGSKLIYILLANVLLNYCFVKCTFIAIPGTFSILFTEVYLVKNFLFLKSFTGTFYSVSLISSSAKQNREQLYSNHYRNHCCSTVFSFRYNKYNASCPCKSNIKKRSFNHHFNVCLRGDG